MLWECPFNRHGTSCSRFDGPCEPHSPGCLLANAPQLAADEEIPDRPFLIVEPMPWPTMARPRRPAGRTRRRRPARASERSPS